MAQAPFTTQSERVALRGSVTQAAKTWGQYLDYLGSSGLRDRASDPGEIYRDKAQVFSTRARGVAEETRVAADRAIASSYSHGLGESGLTQKRVGGVLAGQAGRVAGIRAELGAETRREVDAVEAQWLAAQQRVGQLEANVLSAQQQLALRYSQAGIKNERSYLVGNQYVNRFAEDTGLMTSANEYDAARSAQPAMPTDVQEWINKIWG